MNTIVEMIAKAILRGKKTFKGIKLPSPQGAGTYTQKTSYAKYAAKRVYTQNVSLFQ
jgi:hypothetical protein